MSLVIEEESKLLLRTVINSCGGVLCIHVLDPAYPLLCDQKVNKYAVHVFVCCLSMHDNHCFLLMLLVSQSVVSQSNAVDTTAVRDRSTRYLISASGSSVYAITGGPGSVTH